MKILANLTTGLIAVDYSESWKCLRGVAHSAVHKYIKSEQLPSVVNGSVDEMVDLMMKEESIGKAFNPSRYFQLAVYGVMSTLNFGKK